MKNQFCYCEDGVAISDFEIEEEYKNLLQEMKENIFSDNAPSVFTMAYSTENMIYRIRLGILEGDIDYKYTTFQINGNSYPASEIGNIQGLPADAMDHVMKLTGKIVQMQINKRKADKPKNIPPERKEKSPKAVIINNHPKPEAWEDL